MLVHLIHSVAGQSTPHLFVSLCLILPESRKVADPVQDSRMQIRACMQVQIESGECNLASASKCFESASKIVSKMLDELTNLQTADQEFETTTNLLRSFQTCPNASQVKACAFGLFFMFSNFYLISNVNKT